MIQDFTHVQYFTICLKVFSPHPSSLPCLPHILRGFAHCTVLFLLKNPVHKQDKWFKNNSHNLKINEGRGFDGVGGVGGKEVGRGWEVETCILSFHHASGRVVAGAAAAILAGLQPLQGTWSLGLSFKIFLLIHNDPKGERKRERNPLPQ